MFELSEEETLMYSDDRSITLTTHRVIYNKSNDRKQLMLEDFESYEIKTAHIGNYKTLTVIFSVLALLLFASRTAEYFQDISILSDVGFGQYLLLFPGNFLVILLGISIFFLLISRRNMLRINGKFNSIEFRVYNPKGKSFQRFVETLVAQSNRIKEKSKL